MLAHSTPSKILARILPDRDVVEWVVLDAQNRVLSEPSQTRPDAVQCRAVKQVLGLVPSEKIWLGDAPIKAANMAQRRRAVPFAVEDQLADPIEQLHFAMDASVDGNVPVMAVQKQLLAHWLKQFRGLGIEPDAVYPDALVLPMQRSTVPLLLDGDRALVRVGKHRGFAAGVGLLPMFLKPIQAERQLDVHLCAANANAESFESAPPTWLGDATIARTPTPLHVHARGLTALPSFDLLQTEFAPRARGTDLPRLWRMAAGLLLTLALAALVHIKLDQWQLQSRRTALRDAIAQVFAASMPTGSKAVLGRERAQMEAALSMIQGGQNAGVLQPLAQVGAILANQPRYRVDRIEYREGRLSLTVFAPDVPALEALRESTEQSMKTSNNAVKLEQINPNDAGVSGTLHVGVAP